MKSQSTVAMPSVRLSEQVAQALSVQIHAHHWSAGEKLPTEAVLAAQFAVSRTVVREALSRLKSQGLVDSRQGSGVFAKKPGHAPLQFEEKLSKSKTALIHMVELRRALEAEVAALAAQRRTAADLKRIHQTMVALDRAVAAGGDGAAEDVNYHRALADAASNPFLITTLDYLRQFLYGATRVTRANEAHSAEFIRQVQQEHDAITQAITQGSAELARLAATQHMNNAIVRIEQADPEFWQEEGVQLARRLVQGSH